MKTWLYFILALGGGFSIIFVIDAGIVAHSQIGREHQANQIALHPNVNNQLSSVTNEQVKSACSNLPTTTAQISDVTNPTSTAFRWAATSSAQFETDTAIMLSDNDGPSSNFEAFAIAGSAWEAIATGSQDLIPDPYNVDADPEWHASFVVGNIKIAAPDFDGGDNIPGIYGLIRQRGDCVQIEFSTAYPIDTKVDSGDIPYYAPIFPYRYQYDVFVSNWTALPPILAQYSTDGPFQ